MNTVATQNFRLIDDLDIAAMIYAAVKRIQDLRAKTVSNFRACVQRANERRALARLNDRMLSDIGLSRIEIDREVHKLPWQK